MEEEPEEFSQRFGEVAVTFRLIRGGRLGFRLARARAWMGGWYVHHLRWWLRLGIWVLALPLFLLRPWLPLVWPPLFEAMFLTVNLRSRGRRVGPPPRGVDPGYPGSGVREPRRPGPFAGAGAMAVPEPEELV
jgi:hypothetical protein